MDSNNNYCSVTCAWNSGENEVLTGMKDELGKLTTLPEEVSRSGTMTGMNEKEFYTRQQAYGLLLSACNPHLNSDSVQQVHRQ